MSWVFLIVGCFWAGVLLACLPALVFGFVGGYIWSGVLGRRDGHRILEKMISTEGSRLADSLRRDDVEEGMRTARRYIESADLILLAMSRERTHVS